MDLISIGLCFVDFQNISGTIKSRKITIYKNVISDPSHLILQVRYI